MPKRRQRQINQNLSDTHGSNENDTIECACYPAEACMMKKMDVSKSLHKCCKCNAKILAVCAPQFEDTNEVHCRRCTISIPTITRPKIS